MRTEVTLAVVGAVVFSIVIFSIVIFLIVFVRQQKLHEEQDQSSLPGFPIFVVSLQKERYQRLVEGLKPWQERLEKIDATDGRQIDRSDWVRRGWVTPDSSLKLGELGCFDSYRRVWQLMIDRGIPVALVLEDDARISHPEQGLFLEQTLVPELALLAWDIAFIGYTWNAPLEKIVSRHFARPDMTGGWHVTHAYMLKLEGARKLVQSALPYDKPLDVYIATRPNNLTILQTLPSLISTWPSVSDTQGIN